MKKTLVFLGSLLCSCTVDLSVDPDAQLSCSSDADCPQALPDCVADRCVDLGGPVPPTVQQLTLDSNAGLAVDSLSFSAILSDPNAVNSPVDVTLSGEFSIAGGAWTTASLSAGQSAEATAAGVSVNVTWNLLSDADNGLSGLSSIDIDTTGDGQNNARAAAYTPEVQFRVVAEDDSGRSVTSAPTSAFAVGAAPIAATLIVPAPSDAISNAYPIEFTLEDPSLTLSDIELQFLRDSESSWRRAAISQGSQENLIPDPSLNYVVVWDTQAPLNDDVELPQGVGATVAEVQIRMRGLKDIGEVDGQPTQLFGAWSTPLTLPTVLNQTAPRIESVVSPRADSHAGSSMVPISYRVIDAELDPVDVLFEYSFDSGATWERCREILLPQSEGSSHLATDSGEGIVHTFLWDAGGLRFDAQQRARLRLTVTDGFNTPQSQQVTLGSPISATGNSTPFTRLETDVGGSATEFAVGDLNNDGLDEFIVTPSGVTPRVYRARNSAGSVVFDFVDTLSQGVVACTPVAVRLADLNADGNLDATYVCNSSVIADNRLFVALGTGNGLFPTPTGYSVGLRSSTQHDIADIDGDGALDVVVLTRGDASDGDPPPALRLFWGELSSGNPTGTLTLGPSYGNFMDDFAVMALGDLNDDGLADAVLGSSGISNEQIEVHLNQGDTTRTTPFAFDRAETVNGPLQSIRSYDDRLWVTGRTGVFEITDTGVVELSAGMISTTGVNLLLEDSNLQDLSGDGVADLLLSEVTPIGNPYIARVSIGQKQSDGTVLYGQPEALYETAGTRRIVQTRLGDANGDGVTDIFVATSSADIIEVGLLHPSASPLTSDYATLAQNTPLGADVADGYPRRLLLEDIDKDGALDLIYAAEFNVQLFGGQSFQGLAEGGFEFVSVSRPAARAADPSQNRTWSFPPSGSPFRSFASGWDTDGAQSVLWAAGHCEVGRCTGPSSTSAAGCGGSTRRAVDD